LGITQNQLTVNGTLYIYKLNVEVYMKEIVLEELSSPGCTHCAAFKEFWDGEAVNWPNVKFTERSLLNPDGQEMVQKYQIFASPGIVINGELFATGGVDKVAFIQKLKNLSGE
jgi:glutaredoxin